LVSVCFLEKGKTGRMERERKQEERKREGGRGGGRKEEGREKGKDKEEEGGGRKRAWKRARKGGLPARPNSSMSISVLFFQGFLKPRAFLS
jgi:hypothetical protein